MQHAVANREPVGVYVCYDDVFRKAKSLPEISDVGESSFEDDLMERVGDDLMGREMRTPGRVDVV